MNINETQSGELLITDIFYKTNREEVRIPYEVLSGVRTIKPEDKGIQEWLENRNNIKIEYVYKGKCINVDHGLYLEGVLLYLRKNSFLPDNTIPIKRTLYSCFRFSGLENDWGIVPEEAIDFIILENELRKHVDYFIYYRLKNIADSLGARLEFTSLELSKKINQDYEYRLCYANEDELKRHDLDGTNSAFMDVLKRLTLKNNYAAIYDDICPQLRFIIKKA